VAKVGTSNPDRTISLKRLQCVVENIHKPVKALQAFIVECRLKLLFGHATVSRDLDGLLPFINHFLNQLQYLMLILSCNLINRTLSVAISSDNGLPFPRMSSLSLQTQLYCYCPILRHSAPQTY
jgi:hypothetical protein